MALASGAAYPGDEQAVRDALDWLAATRNADGSFETFATNVVEAVTAAGLDPALWPTPQDNALAQLQPYPRGGDQKSQYSSMLRNAFAAGTSGHDPRSVNGHNFVARIRDGHHTAQSGEVGRINDDMWAILGLRAAGVPASDPQIRDALLQLDGGRASDGGWNYISLAPRGDTDLTGMALAAYRAAGRDVSGDGRARAFLDDTFVTTGGHARSRGGTTPHCQSTVWAIHGYAALGVAPDPRSLDFLRSLRNSDGGFAEKKDPKTGENLSSDAFCTAEAVVLLAGARPPFPTWAPTQVLAPAQASTGEPVTLRLRDAFASVEWRVGDTRVDGADASLVFEEPGTYRYHVTARSAGTVHRASGDLHVVEALPELRLAPLPQETARRVELLLDARGSTSPDGSPLRLRVDWGDGTVTMEPGLLHRHAYVAPGEPTLRISITDGKGRIAERFHTLHVRNAPPVLEALPTNLVTDRVTPFTLDLAAADAEGDALTFSWRIGGGEWREPPVSERFTTLGNHTLDVRVVDAWSATDEARVEVRVVNLPPVVRELRLPAQAEAGVPFGVAVDAHDPDSTGPPTVVWSIGNRSEAGARVNVTLEAGTHPVNVTVTDADGGQATAAATLVVRPPGTSAARANATAAPTQPGVANVTATLREGRLTVVFDAWPANATRIVRWTSDAGSGERAIDGSRIEIELPDATWAETTVDVAYNESVSSASSGRVHAPVPRTLRAPEVRMWPELVRAGELVRVVASVRGAPVVFDIDFGDGSRATASVGEVEHVYAAPGLRELHVVARAPDGRTSETRVHVVVHEAAAAPTANEGGATDEQDNKAHPDAVLVPSSARLGDEPSEDEPLVSAADAPGPGSRPVPGPSWGAAFAALAFASRLALRTRPPSGRR